ncbi:DsbA family protein [Streptodolium elevatio]|uniref:Thioredoxin domain-containing protein n=1 Tax=Streptodolium elevatio TaxID=3157996 RepID=A0ABV3DJT7_9ACTN
MRIILGAEEGPTSRAYRRRVVAVAAVGLLAVVMGILAQFAQAGSAPTGGTSPGETPTAPIESHSRRDAVPAAAYSTPFVRPASPVATNDPMAVGRADAPVVMVEYADFLCGYCTRFARDTGPEIVSRYVDAGVLRIEFRNFPIRGEGSDELARAAWAAAQQGRFWEFHNSAYQAGAYTPAAESTPLGYARAAGVPDLDRFAADMASPAARQAVDDTVAEGVAAGAEMTPTFFVNGKKLVGALPNQTFFDEIDAAAREARSPYPMRGYGQLL